MSGGSLWRSATLYLAGRLGVIRGVRRLMLLVFLSGYTSCHSGVTCRVVYQGEALTPGDYIVWGRWPVLSNSVLELSNTLHGSVQQGEVVFKTPGKPGQELPEPVREWLDIVASLYGGESTDKLASTVKQMLGLTGAEQGVPVEEQLKARQGSIPAVDAEELARAAATHTALFRARSLQPA